MDSERKEFIDTILSEKSAIEILIQSKIKRVIKNALLSEEARKEGNQLFTKKSHNSEEHENILRLYNKSIALAFDGSEELALAYSNRSAFLFHIEKYKESIQDIDRALLLTSSSSVEEKLFYRKLKCLLELRQPVDEKFSNEIEKIPETSKGRKILMQLLDRAKSIKRSDLVEQDDKIDSIMKELDEKENAFNSIAVKYDKKYGRHLVASRNIEPGEIIFVEKLYATCLSIERTHTNCQHCFAACWSGIPCDSCSWAMFCSEECKSKAMKEYHDIECIIVPYIKTFGSQVFWNAHICIRMMIMALKECGSISQLKRDLESIDKHSLDKDSNEFLMENGVKRQFTTIYSLESNVSKDQMIIYSVIAPSIMICIAKHTEVLGSNFEFKKSEDLVKNKDFVFIGSLFLKLLKIRQVNGYLIANGISPKIHTRPSKFDEPAELSIFKDGIGTGMALIGSLINHSCAPNARRCFTKDKRLLIYALQPIKKNSQIFDSYGGCFYDTSKDQRQSHLANYQFKCDCQACKNDWIYKCSVNPRKDFNPAEMELFSKMERITRSVLDKSKKCNPVFIKELSDALKQAIHCLPPTSTITCTLYSLIGEVFDKIYSFERDIYKPCDQ